VALMPVAEALDRVLAHATPLPPHHVGLQDAHGRVLAEDLAARRTQPPEDVSAMDGYAARAADVAHVPTTLKVIGEVAAGRPFAGSVTPGCAARIFTGGVVPDGADTIVIQEHVVREGDTITINIATPLNKHIRRAGLDFSKGDVLLKKGRVLTGRDISLAASMNHATLPVHGAPHVAVLATGDELVMPGTEPGPGQIVYSNGYSVMALARGEGAQVIDLGVVPDRVEETVAAIRRAREAKADILVTTGGASVGDYDLVQQALSAEGLEISFWRVALRPGRPMMHGRLGAMHVLGLPGNPVSAFVCAVLFLSPLIRKLSGRSDLGPLTEPAVAGIDLPANGERTDYQRATLKPGPGGISVVTPFSAQDSSMMQALAKADCLIVREPFAPVLRAGEPCRIVKLPL
jgi:molybdopterin molybdotransferase